jgi:hypothetical protein
MRTHSWCVCILVQIYLMRYPAPFLPDRLPCSCRTTMLRETLTLLIFTTSIAASTGLWAVNIDEDSAPPIDKVPPIAKNAIRDRVALRWQIPVLIGSYLALVILTISFILTIGRRMRMEALNNRDGKPLEVVKEAKRTFDPSPVSPQSAHSRKRLTHKARTLASPTQKSQVPLAGFDDRVIMANRDQSNRDMGRLYDTVWQEGEPDKQISTFEAGGKVALQSENWQLHPVDSTDSFGSITLQSRPASRGTAWRTTQQTPSSPLRVRHTAVRASASTTTLNTVQSDDPPRRQLSALPQSPRPRSSPHDVREAPITLNRSASTLKRNRRSLRIQTSSSSLPAPQVRSTISMTSLTPLSPLRSHPTSPLDLIQMPRPELGTTVRRVQQSEQTPRTAITYISESASTPRIESAIPSACPVTPYVDRALPPLPLGAMDQDREDAMSATNLVKNVALIKTNTSIPSEDPRPLPFRSFDPEASQAPGLPSSIRMAPSGMAPLRSPAIERTRLTVVTPYQDRFRGRGPPTAGLPTPYSPYFPQTPMTPVTPGLMRKQQRKAQEKEEKKRALGAEDLVKSDEELWREGL